MWLNDGTAEGAAASRVAGTARGECVARAAAGAATGLAVGVGVRCAEGAAVTIARDGIGSARTRVVRPTMTIATRGIATAATRTDRVRWRSPRIGSTVSRISKDGASTAADATVLDRRAAVHDDRQAGVMGDLRRFPVDDAELQPEAARADVDSLAGVRDTHLGAAEDVDDVERSGRVERFAGRPERADPEDVALAWIDRHAVVSLVDEVAEDAERG